MRIVRRKLRPISKVDAITCWAPGVLRVDPVFRGPLPSHSSTAGSISSSAPKPLTPRTGLALDNGCKNLPWPGPSCCVGFNRPHRNLFLAKAVQQTGATEAADDVLYL
jgi:hypothetical protein